MIFQLPIAKTAGSIGADKYIHKCSGCPETTAGESDRIGFIDAPQTGPNVNAIPMCVIAPPVPG